MKNNKLSFIKNARRVVVKIGSGVLTLDNGLNTNIIETISRQISCLWDNGTEVILISSGAIASGVKKIGFKKRPEGIPARQAAAALGQAGLILAYDKAFSKYNRKVAQILLTKDDLSNRKRYLNARNTINKLLSWGVIPVINENDTVAIEEIKLGDNDNLAAMITLLMDADILINLTDIDGLYDKDPRHNPDACLISEVTEITGKMEEAACGIPGNLGTGGMLSKLKAAKKLSKAHIPMVIAKGLKPEILNDLCAGSAQCTYFIPGEKKLNSRKCWLAFNLSPMGAVFLDKGAEDAIVNKGKSLLPIGITRVEGNFNMGASVTIKSGDGKTIGKGLSNYSSVDILSIMGHKSDMIVSILGSKPYNDVIHRDNLAITYDQE